MKPTIPLMLMALLFVACGPLRQFQQPEQGIPSLGSIGKHNAGLFKKDVQKIGEPILETAVAVTVRSVPFSKKKWNHYMKYRESQGLETMPAEQDTANTKQQYYFEAKISDVVGLTAQLNQSNNTDLVEYLQEDIDLVLLSQISFVTDEDTAEKLNSGKPIYLAENAHGTLELLLGNGPKAQTLDMTTLQVFDFEASGFCWKKDQRGRSRIVHILMDGGTCPGETEKDPKKLDKTPDYLKP